MIATSFRNIADAAVVRLAACAVALCFAGGALAQSTPTPQPGGLPAVEPQVPGAPMEPQVPPAPPRSTQPGLFAAFGRWMDDSIGTMTSGWNNTRNAIGGLGGQATEAAKGAAGAAKNAAATIGLPPTSIVTGRSRCRPSANGGPDCVAATDLLCRSKGYAGGTSLHIQSEQKCPVWGWISGAKPVGKCGSETYVTSAMCRIQ